VSSGRVIQTFERHSSDVNAVAFSPNGQFALSGSNTLKLWELSTGRAQHLAQMVSFEDGEWITVTPQGYYIASKNGDKYLNLSKGTKVTGIDDSYRAKFNKPEMVKLLNPVEEKIAIEILKAIQQLTDPLGKNN